MKIIATQDFVEGRIHFIKQDNNPNVYQLPDVHAKRFIDNGLAREASDKDQGNLIVVRESDLTIQETPQPDVMTEPENQVERFREPGAINSPVNPTLDDDVTTQTIEPQAGKQNLNPGNNKRS